MKIGFIFIGYDQFDELQWTMHSIRHHSPFVNAPVSVVLSGDPDHTYKPCNGEVVTHVPNIVKHSVDEMQSHFNMETYHERPGVGAKHYHSPADQWVKETGSESIFRNYQIGINTLIGEDIDLLLVTESNILILDWDTVRRVGELMQKHDRVATFQTVSQKPSQVINWGENDLLPQMFVVDWNFCQRTDFLFKYKNTRPDVMEMALKDNLNHCLAKDNKNFTDHVFDFGTRCQWGAHIPPDFIHFAHLDRPPGSDGDSNLRWDNRAKQLEYESLTMKRFNMCIGECGK